MSVGTRGAGRQGAIYYPWSLAFAVKVFIHADDFMQESNAYRDLAGLPGVPKLLAMGASSTGQRFIVTSYVGKPVLKVTKDLV
jgi:hypothetical protein